MCFEFKKQYFFIKIIDIYLRMILFLQFEFNENLKTPNFVTNGNQR